MTSPLQPAPGWLTSTLKWLNPRRLRAQAIVLAICLWGVCAIDFATAGPFDRAANVKFQDFLPFYISARLIAHDRPEQLYDPQVQVAEVRAIVGQPVHIQVPNLYGPQVALAFVPFGRLSFAAAARIWVTLSLIAYFVCVYSVWRCCPRLSVDRVSVFIAALAFPPLFHFFVRGQMSVIVLACFTAAFLAFRADRPFFAGVLLGILVFKPQFLVAIPLIFLLSFAWKPLIGLVLSAAAQLGFAQIYFGSATMRAYLEMLVHPARWLGAAELSLAPVQMHSLSSFWQLLIPSQSIALALYGLSSAAVLIVAVVAWKSASPPLDPILCTHPRRGSYQSASVCLRLAGSRSRAVAARRLGLTNEHALASPWILFMSYLAFVLPLFGPVSQWTHLQLSVPVFAAILWILARNATPGHKLDSLGPRVI